MEYCMEARALKPRFFREQTVVRPNSSHTQPQPFTADDFLLLSAPGGVVSSDVDFSVDCFFDFSCGEFKDHIIQEKNKKEEEEEEKDSVSISNSSSFSANSLLTSELVLPDDELAELEWVSRFVDDSPLEFSLLHPLTEAKTENHRFKSECKTAGLKITPCFFPTRVPAKPRTKRPRPTGQTWSVGSPPLTDSSSQSPSSSTASVTSTPCLVFNNAVPTDVSSEGSIEPPVKKPKMRPAVQTGGDLLGSVQFQRRCTHCQVQKTPQWRTGPLGPKTLCNACGVRYKSGRLFPEYRPACSPTFSVEVHSNSHRKVLEIRKKKEVGGPDQSPDRTRWVF